MSKLEEEREREREAGGGWEGPCGHRQIMSLVSLVFRALTVNNAKCMEQFSDINGAQVNDLSCLSDNDLK